MIIVYQRCYIFFKIFFFLLLRSSTFSNDFNSKFLAAKRSIRRIKCMERMLRFTNGRHRSDETGRVSNRVSNRRRFRNVCLSNGGEIPVEQIGVHLWRVAAFERIRIDFEKKHRILPTFLRELVLRTFWKTRFGELCH